MTLAKNPALIQVRDLCKSFRMAERGGSSLSLIDALRLGPAGIPVREIKALDGVSIDIHEGERVGIIGHNGAGKTTLLSILAGVAQADSGTLAIEGDVHALLTIGAVLRNESTGRENIRLDGAVHGKTATEVDASIQDIIAFAELGEFIDRPVGTYSSGMKARLAFSMAAFAEPDIFIVDETLSVGDSFFAAKASARMRELARRGRILIIVSHALSSIVDMTDRCIWLDGGRVAMDGDPATVTAAYRNAVSHADEVELAAKFGAAQPISRRAEGIRLDALELRQAGTEVATVAKAFVPMSLVLLGSTIWSAGVPDMKLTIMRADGRMIADMRLSENGGALPDGPFTLTVDFEPMQLGAALYRLEATILADGLPVQSLVKVFEVTDEEGQFGGQPLLLDPPRVLVLDEEGQPA